MIDFQEEFAKICIAPFLFLELCKINDADANKVIPFESWPHLIKLIGSFLCKKLIIILKAKQVGVSYLLAFYALWKALTVRGFNCVIISEGQVAAARLLEKSKFAYLSLPGWIRQNCPFSKWSETEIKFSHTGSRIAALPSTETPGVGETVSLAIIDEWDFHPFPESDWAAVEPTASAPGGQIIGASTIQGNDFDSKFIRMYKQAKEGLNNFYPVFLSCFVRPGRDEIWYAAEEKNYLDEPWRMAKNYPRTEEEALSPIAGTSFFNTTVLKSQLDLVLEPMETRYGFTYLFSKFQPSIAYACGADISQGVGRDYQAMVILGKRGFSVEDVAYIHTNDLAVKTYAFHANELAKEYNFPIMAAEANTMGRSFLDELTEVNYPNLFYRDENRTKLGWWTDSNSREMALVKLNEALTNGSLIIRFKPALLQLLDFQRLEGRSGKIEIRSVGKHDDLVMALAIAYQMLKDLRPPSKIKMEPRLVERATQGMYK